jgi:hypothetical protein
VDNLRQAKQVKGNLSSIIFPITAVNKDISSELLS